MKKKCIMALIIGAAFLAQGCGYEEGTDAVVTVVDSTPTPEPTEKPKATATPTPKAAADSTADGAAAAADSTTAGAADPAARQQLRSRLQAASTYRLRMPPTMQWRV